MQSFFPNQSLTLSLTNKDDHDELCRICHALSSPERVKILYLLQNKSCSYSEISRMASLPFTSLLRHIDILEQANLISVHYQPSPKGHARFCTLKLIHFETFFENTPETQNDIPEIVIEMPIGMYTNFEVKKPCGLLGKDGPIGEFDDPGILFSPDRATAECLWFSSGFVSYNFPCSQLKQHNVSEISFSLELCSEAPYYNNKWPSDITFSINGTELLTYTSPSDFGGKRGKYTPSFWPITSTQFGQLKNITINKNGVYLDNLLANPQITIEQLNLSEKNSIEFTLAVKKDAKHCGGINIFGANFGNHPQHIIMRVKTLETDVS